MTGPRLGEVHLLTPGDHYSPRTGSAVPTVVHGLASASARRPTVLVARGTYPDRYASADVVEYDQAPVPPRAARAADAGLGRLGLPRPAARRELGAALSGQERWAPSVVLAHNAPQLVPLVRGPHVPVLYAHNDLLRTYGRAEIRRTLDRAGAIVCVSTYLADHVREQVGPRLAERVVVVRNGVDVEQFRPRAAPRDDDELHVLFVGRVVPEKGVHVLVEALARLDRTDVRATVVGSQGFDAAAGPSPYEQSLRARAGVLGHRVSFLPFQGRSRVVALMQDADVVVVPSVWSEPSGLTVLEGMASGAAVVASSVGGIPELAGDGARLVPPDDPAAVAEVIELLATDRAELARARTAARAWAEANSWDRARHDLDAALRSTS
ncbi:glycosyltransferase family 4 protein [Cellulosimicrobium arenosum]|uniref:D-inositol 3-phosphate glycosyltransferase n=1 Tax=Cellulosimicrobium arenosum TaxID=2708133 RepID=A0A927G926_9MICO|nr:glycosyltransferase family 4 protein [Cellulosimicrobium arenosum]MBD8078948.1 glycosyltransferase family 4 protein [Cellulosimicrobium arenosum]